MRRVLLIFQSFLAMALCAIHQYRDIPLRNMYIKYRTGFMAAGTAEKASFIKFNLQFILPNEAKPGAELPSNYLEDRLVQVTIFPVDSVFEAVQQDDQTFAQVLESQTYCCAADQSTTDDSVCFQPNILFSPLLGDKNPGARSFYIDFEGNELQPDGSFIAEADGIYQVEQSGLYALVFSYCYPTESTVLINGHTTWSNSYGLLPAELYGFLDFYLNISMVYAFIAAGWGFLCYRHWKNLLLLQNWITVVLILGMIEVNLRYFDFHTYNESGIRHQNLLLFALMFLALKKALSRMLVLVVSMGFGVVKPSLGDEKNKVFYMGLGYFVLALFDSLFASFSSPLGTDTQSAKSVFFVTFLQIPLAMLDVMFAFWIFKSLNTTLLSLSKRGQDVKLSLYKKFRSLLYVILGAAAVWIIVSAHAKLTLGKPWEEPSGFFSWENIYMVECFWDVLHPVVLMAIMFLWLPSEHALQYSYSAVKKYDDGEEYDNDLDVQESPSAYKLGRNGSHGSSFMNPAHN